MGLHGDPREFFHLVLLRLLAGRLHGRRWAVKGGIGLRFFHRSPRLSEDMDLDVEPKVRPDTLRGGVEGILAGGAFGAQLAARGVSAVSWTAPKQTATVQRWKVALRAEGGRSLTTKIEFSRRGGTPAVATGLPEADVLERYAFPPFAASYYGAAAMTALKIRALAAPGRTAVRDLFDLDHLLTTRATTPAGWAALVDARTLEAARERAGEYTARAFRDDVLPFLEPEVTAAFTGARAFEALRDRVTAALAAAAGGR